MWARQARAILTTVTTDQWQSASDGQPSEPPCRYCIEQGGLCKRHSRSVCPQLAQPFWYRLVGTDAQKSAEQEMSPEARRIAERKRRKAAKRASDAARGVNMSRARQRSLEKLRAA